MILKFLLICSGLTLEPLDPRFSAWRRVLGAVFGCVMPASVREGSCNDYRFHGNLYNLQTDLYGNNTGASRTFSRSIISLKLAACPPHPLKNIKRESPDPGATKHFLLKERQEEQR